MARIYQKTKGLLEQVQKMSDEGLSQREIATVLGLHDKSAVKNLLYRTRRERKDTIPKRKGRPRTRPLTTEEECRKEIARLEMENKLLRDFLSLTEGM